MYPIDISFPLLGINQEPQQLLEKPKRLTDLSLDQLAHILSYLPKASEFAAAALTCRTSYIASTLDHACKSTDLVPNYLAQSTNPKVAQLNNKEKMALAAGIEQKLTSSEPLREVFSKEFFQWKSFKSRDFFIGSDSFIGEIGNYLVYTTARKVPNTAEKIHRPTQVVIHNLLTGSEKSIHLGDKQTCLLADKDNPKLITLIKEASPFGFQVTALKVWDLEQLMEENDDLPEPLLHLDYTGEKAKDIPIAVTDDLLVTARNPELEIRHLQNLSAAPFINRSLYVSRLEFSEGHLVASGYNEVSMWSIGHLKTLVESAIQGSEQEITMQPCFQMCLELDLSGGIAFTKTYGDTLAIFYESPESTAFIEDIINYPPPRYVAHVSGEVWNWQTNTRLRYMIDEAAAGKPVDCAIFSENMMYTGRGRLEVRDLTNLSKPQFTDYFAPRGSVHTICNIGKSLLVASSKGVIIDPFPLPFDNTRYTQIELVNGVPVLTPPPPTNDRRIEKPILMGASRVVSDTEELTHFQLHGNLIITRTEDPATQAGRVVVYDLSNEE